MGALVALMLAACPAPGCAAECQRGDGAACMRHAESLVGESAELDVPRLAQWWSRACRLGDAQGCYALGQVALRRGDARSAREQFEKACRAAQPNPPPSLLAGLTACGSPSYASAPTPTDACVLVDELGCESGDDAACARLVARGDQDCALECRPRYGSEPFPRPERLFPECIDGAEPIRRCADEGHALERTLAPGIARCLPNVARWVVRVRVTRDGLVLGVQSSAPAADVAALASCLRREHPSHLAERSPLALPWTSWGSVVISVRGPAR